MRGRHPTEFDGRENVSRSLAKDKKRLNCFLAWPIWEIPVAKKNGLRHMKSAFFARASFAGFLPFGAKAFTPALARLGARRSALAESYQATVTIADILIWLRAQPDKTQP